MAYPNYYDPIIDDAMNLAGMDRKGYESLLAQKQAATNSPLAPQPAQWSIGSPKPGIRNNLSTADYLKKLNGVENQINGINPYFQQAMQRDAIRQKEDMRKFQRDYRSQLMGGNTGRAQTISGTGARMTGVPTAPGVVGGPAAGSYGVLASRGIADPVTSSFKALAQPVF